MNVNNLKGELKLHPMDVLTPAIFVFLFWFAADAVTAQINADSQIMVKTNGLSIGICVLFISRFMAAWFDQLDWSPADRHRMRKYRFLWFVLVVVLSLAFFWLKPIEIGVNVEWMANRMVPIGGDFSQNAGYLGLAIAGTTLFACMAFLPIYWLIIVREDRQVDQQLAHEMATQRLETENLLRLDQRHHDNILIE